MASSPLTAESIRHLANEWSPAALLTFLDESDAATATQPSSPALANANAHLLRASSASPPGPPVSSSSVEAALTKGQALRKVEANAARFISRKSSSSLAPLLRDAATTLAWAATVLQLFWSTVCTGCDSAWPPLVQSSAAFDNAIKRLSMEQPSVLARFRHAGDASSTAAKAAPQAASASLASLFSSGPSKGADATRCASRRMSAAPSASNRGSSSARRHRGAATTACAARAAAAIVCPEVLEAIMVAHAAATTSGNFPSTPSASEAHSASPWASTSPAINIERHSAASEKATVAVDSPAAILTEAPATHWTHLATPSALKTASRPRCKVTNARNARHAL